MNNLYVKFIVHSSNATTNYSPKSGEQTDGRMYCITTIGIRQNFNEPKTETKWIKDLQKQTNLVVVQTNDAMDSQFDWSRIILSIDHSVQVSRS